MVRHGASKNRRQLTTYEIDAQRAAATRANFKKAGMDDVITLVEGDAREEIKKLKDPIDISISMQIRKAISIISIYFCL